ncbi:MAG: squalene--hopene cyclase [Acidobacteriota bacterium]
MTTEAPRIQADTMTRLKEAIRRAQEHVLEQQNLEGFWWAELEANVTLTAEYVMLHTILGSSRHRQLQQARRYLLREQRAHGGWELFFGDGGDLSTSVEAYFALKLTGETFDSEPMLRAREFILKRGGLTRARVFTKLHLALFGAYPWAGVPLLPPWFVLLPTWFPFNIYEMASWARSSTVPLLIVCDRKPIHKTDTDADELFAEGSRAGADFRLRNTEGTLSGAFFIGLDRLLKFADKLGFVPFRQRAIERAERWIIERQDPTGDWAGIIPAMLNSILALHVLGYPVDHPCVKRGLEAIDRFGIEDSTGVGMEEANNFRLQPCISPTWDTALVLTALVDSGMSPDHPRLKQAGDWLLSQQIFRYGDWSIKNTSGKPAGWAFEFANDCYPDVDDTAAVVMALLSLKLDDESAKQEACRAAAEWVLSMQCRLGGWAAFDIDNTQELFNRMPYGDLKAMIDPPTADLTGRVLEMLRYLADHLKRDLIPRQDRDRATDFLLTLQEGDGSWWGRWGVNYIYGTYLAIVGLRSAGFASDREEIGRAGAWLQAAQNEDGGWGETCASYSRPELRGQGPSTASQTAWALIGLMASGDRESKSVSRGIEYLIERQGPDGGWPEREFTGTGFPGHFYINYHQYRVQFPLTALGRFLRDTERRAD